MSFYRNLLILNYRFPIPVASYRWISASTISPFVNLISANPLRFLQRPSHIASVAALFPEFPTAIVSTAVISVRIPKSMAHRRRAFAHNELPLTGRASACEAPLAAGPGPTAG